MNRNTIDNILTFLEEKEGKEIPERWNIVEKLENHPDDTQYMYESDLFLINSNISKLPNDLYVDGSLELINCQQLTQLPIKLHVEDDLRIYNCAQITELPNDLYVGGDYLDLRKLKNLIYLPNNLYIKGDLYLDKSGITELPDNLQVRGDLFILEMPLLKYTDKQIREIVASTGGKIEGEIIR